MGKSLLCIGLNRIKKKHGDITIKEWAAKSGVPEASVARFLSSSLNIPNFPAVCAMLKCLNESIDDFYNSLDEKIDAPVEALRLDAVPVAVVGDIPVDMPETKAEIQERILVQVEEVQRQQAIAREKDNQIELLKIELSMSERVMEEKDRTIATLEDLCKRRLQAIQALCSAQ